MLVECPDCHTQMSPSGSGWLCLQCGASVRRYHAMPVIPQSPLHDVTADSNAGASRLDEPLPTPTTEENTPPHSLAPNPDTPSPSRQIINHHASSHYRRRLNERLHALEEPELPSGIDPASEIEPPAAPEGSTPVAEVAPLPTDAPTTLSQPDAAIDTGATDTTPESFERPFRPSAHVVSATTPLESHSNEVSTPAPTISPSAVDPAQAHAQADALLAAAASPARTTAETSNTNRTIILAVASLVIILAGGIGAWMLLRPSTTPSASPRPTASATPTPTASLLGDAIKRDTRRKSDLNSIAIGLEAYHRATGSYPVGNDIGILNPLTQTSPPYITAINNDPSSSTDGSRIVKYSYSSDGSSFTLSATLEQIQDPDSKNGLYIVRNGQSQQ